MIPFFYYPLFDVDALINTRYKDKYLFSLKQIKIIYSVEYISLRGFTSVFIENIDWFIYIYIYINVRVNKLSFRNLWKKRFRLVEFMTCICESKTKTQDLLNKSMFLDSPLMLNSISINPDLFYIFYIDLSRIADSIFLIWHDLFGRR